MIVDVNIYYFYLGGVVLEKKKIGLISTLFIVIIVGMVSCFIIFSKKTAKNLKIGNNTSSQEIVDYILNISSYETKIEVEVQSNKNQNKYILKQQYKGPDRIEQEVIEPNNIAGFKISKEGNQLKIENTNLSLSSIFENYEYVADNVLDLCSFIKDYQSDEKADWKEENNQIIMTIKQENAERKLFIDRNTGKPQKMEVKWVNKNTTVYILYNEVNINTLH